MEDSKESKVEEEVVVEISVEEVVVTAEEVKLAETAEDKPAESEKDEKPAVTAEEEAPADTAKEEKPAEAAEVEEEATPAAKSSKKGATKKGTATKDEEELPDADENKEDVEMEVVPSTENQKKKRKASSTPQTGDSSGKSPAKRERRERKSVEPFNPEDFKHVDKSVTIVPGRGKELGELKATRASIEKRANSEDLVTAHKLLFPSKNRKLAKKEMLANVLAFSGYLPIKEEGLDKEEQEAIDEDCEVRIIYASVVVSCRMIDCKLTFSF